VIQKSNMHVDGKSDGRAVPNKSGNPLAEGAEGRRPTKENAEQTHHVSVPLLESSFYALKRDAAPGVDGVTWQEYETGLGERLKDLHSRVHRGTYRAQPSTASQTQSWGDALK